MRASRADPVYDKPTMQNQEKKSSSKSKERKWDSEHS